jgi:hypothetical protein
MQFSAAAAANAPAAIATGMAISATIMRRKENLQFASEKAGYAFFLKARLGPGPKKGCRKVPLATILR